MTNEEALEILERDDNGIRSGYFCIDDFTAIEKLKETVKDLNSGEAISREEAILQIQKYGVGCLDSDDFTPETCERFVIDLLKKLSPMYMEMQESPCEDAISREDVIKAIDRHTFNTDDGLCLDEDITIILEELPPVKPVACIDKVNFSKEDMQEIVDKKIGELEMEKHTDRQIYDGCIHLMQNMVDYFQEYLDYLGYDLDQLDEDERFEIGISNMEIVRQLFLYRTGNSGGCSTRDFCKKLGVDPYKSVKFELDWYEEE